MAAIVITFGVPFAYLGPQVFVAFRALENTRNLIETAVEKERALEDVVENGERGR